MKLTTTAITAVTNASVAFAAADTTVSTKSALLPLVFSPLPLGQITPSGWLASTLETSAAGLAGHEHDFYQWVSDSSWTGGNSEYSELNEGLPYWFNGLVPLAYALDDARLKSQVHSVADYILTHQQADGWIGPEAAGARTFWGRYPLFLGMMQLADANATWEAEIVPRLYRFNSLMHEMMVADYSGYHHQNGDGISFGDFQWGQVRYQDMMISLMWLYESHPNGTAQQQMLVDNMNFLNNGSIDWAAWYDETAYLKQDLYTVPDSVTNANYMYEHGVNVGQGLKAAAVVRRVTHNESLVQTAMNGVNWTFTYHGAPSGTVIADERMDGLSPYSGSEVCTHVETMYSLSYNYQALGNAYYADQCELTAFNALPASMTPDWWAHQYMLETNQPFSTHLSDSPFFNTNAWGQTMGLEPNYPCCAVNHPQGFPKFLSASYLTNNENGLIHALLSPASVKTKISSGKVAVECATKYPFGNTLIYTIHSDNAFDFFVRVPSWYQVDGSSVNGHSLAPDSTSMLHKVSLPAGYSRVNYTLTSSIRSVPRANDTIAIYHGALLYGLEISSTNTSTLPRNYGNQSFYPVGYAPAQARDYIITNTSAWNYAIDPSTLKFQPGNVAAALPEPIFSPGAPPMSITAMACQIDWPLFRGSVPGAVPLLANRKCISNVTQVRLVPFGSAKLHMAELPTIALPK